MTSPVPQVDVHAHLLPGVDDGPADEESSLAMLERAAADGTRVIAATPHAGRCPPEAIIAGVERLNRRAEQAGLEIRVVVGCEYPLSRDLVEHHRKGDLVTLNGTPYVLVEFITWVEWPPYFAQAVYELQLEGFIPVLAHPERYPPVQRRPELLVEAVRAGVVLQLNAGSLLGQYGPVTRRTAEQLVRARLAHVIASDAHDPKRRPPTLAEAFQRASQLAGEEYVLWMRQAAVAVVEGRALVLPEPEVGVLEAERSWLGRLRSWLR